MQKIALLESEKHNGMVGAGSAASVALHVVVLAFAIAVTSHAGHDLTHDRMIFVPLPRWHPTATAVKQAAAAPLSPARKATTHIPALALAIPAVIPPSVPGPAMLPVTPTNFGQATSAPSGSPVGPDSAIDVSNGNIALEDHQVDSPAAALGGQRGPVYPDALRAMGVDGRVIARFIVEKNGRVESEPTILSSTADAFSTAVKRYLAAARYRPAMYKGQPVRQLADQEFEFTVRR